MKTRICRIYLMLVAFNSSSCDRKPKPSAKQIENFKPPKSVV